MPHHRTPSFALASAFLGGVLAACPAAARADDSKGLVFLSPGYLYAKVSGDSPATAHGAELSVHWLHPKLPFGVGGFVQLQRYDGDHDRMATGVQATFALLGLELGVAHRMAGNGAPIARSMIVGDVTTERSATTGLHVAPFLTLGVVHIAYRWTIPLHEGPAPSQGSEHALTIGVKIPLQIGGKSVWKGLADGLWMPVH
jgi:hypothetical protein